MISLKKLNIGDKTSKITIEHNSTEKSLDADCEVRALAVLLGGYNEFGRGIDLEKYKTIKEEFDYCIMQIKKML